MNRFLETQLLRFEAFNSAAGIAERVDDYYRQQIVNGNRAYLESNNGKYLLAEEHFLLAIEISQRLQFFGNLSDWQRGLGDVYRKQGKFSQSLKTYKESEQTALMLGPPHSHQLINTKLDLAAVYREIGQQDLAYRVLLESIENARNIKASTSLNRGILMLSEILCRKKRIY